MVAEFITYDKEHLPGSCKTDVSFYLPALTKKWAGKPFSVSCNEPSTPIPTMVMSRVNSRASNCSETEEQPQLNSDSLLKESSPELTYTLVVNLHHDGQDHNAYLDINLL